ncbi:MAG: DUF262 domain-containing HNH endonuclease family protein [Nanopusillaceae archaeon]
MKAEVKSLKFLSTEGKLVVPFFQRNYVWQQENWQGLLNELLDERNKSIFLGAIILKELDSSPGVIRTLEIIDGQQRLTTLSILLKALYDTLPQEIKKHIEYHLLDLLKIRKYDEPSTWEPRLKLSYSDEEAYTQLFENDFKQNYASESLIIQCYNYFIEELKKKSINENLKLFNKLLTTELFVVIYLDKEENEQFIFDILNTTGVRLSLADLVKSSLYNHYRELLNQIKDSQKTEELDKIFKDLFNKWDNVFIGNEEALSYWDRTKTMAGISHDQKFYLLYSIAIIKRIYDPEKHNIDDLIQLYKNYITNKSLEELKIFIEEIINYANIYREYFKPIDDETEFSFEDSLDSSIMRILHILEKLNIVTFYPFLLFLFKEHKNNKDKIISILRKIEKLVIRNAIVGKFSNNYSSLCKEFIEDTSKIDKRLAELTLEEVSKNLRGESGKQLNLNVAKLLLFWIELYRRRKNNLQQKLKYEYTLEHIMPINWRQYWDFKKVPHPRGDIMSLEEQEKDRNQKIHWLGNMTLLKSDLNMSIKNFDFSRKMEGERDKPGIKDLGATLSITKDDIVIPYVMGDKVWNEAKIEARTEKLEKELKEIWG